MAETPTNPNHAGRLPGEAERVTSLEAEAANLESVTLSAEQLADLALILDGACRPLSGFMNEADYLSVLQSMRLSSGACFPLPVVLDVDLTTARSFDSGQRLALRDGEGLAYAVLDVESVWRRDAAREAEAMGADSASGDRGSCCIGGTVNGIRAPSHPFYAWLRPGPAALRQWVSERGFKRVISVESGAAIHPPDHALITRAAAELDAAVILQPAVGFPDPGNLDQVVTVKCHLAALPLFSTATTVLALLDYAGRPGGIRSLLMQAMLRRRFGATHLMVKGVTQREIDADARVPEILRELDVEVVAWPQPAGNSADGAAGAGLIERFHRGDPPGGNAVFPEAAAVLDAHYGDRAKSGFTLFFTGLSGSGKSTIAKIVQARLAERDARRVTLLDGDIVRRQFSRGLGFSPKDRDTNVRRIGAAAADYTKRGGIAICCPIAPYAASRQAARSMIEPHGPMVEIHVSTPIEICEQRDPKGLYRKARQGSIQNFTGIDDPYETPENPELRLDASAASAEAAAAEVLAHLQDRGLIAPPESGG